MAHIGLRRGAADCCLLIGIHISTEIVESNTEGISEDLQRAQARIRVTTATQPPHVIGADRPAAQPLHVLVGERVALHARALEQQIQPVSERLYGHILYVLHPQQILCHAALAASVTRLLHYVAPSGLDASVPKYVGGRLKRLACLSE